MSTRRLLAQLRVYRMRSRRFLLEQVLHANDPPHRLALGCAIGIFVMFTPTIGIQSLLVVAIAWLLRANKVIGLPVLWISNPATVLPIYGACYWLGVVILGQQQQAVDNWRHLSKSISMGAMPLKTWWHAFMDSFMPLWVGGIILGFLCAIPTYYLVFWSVRAHRQRHRAARN